MDVPKFQSLARSAMNEREMRSLSGGNVCGCACRSNSTMDNGSANHAWKPQLEGSNYVRNDILLGRGGCDCFACSYRRA